MASFFILMPEKMIAPILKLVELSCSVLIFTVVVEK